MEDSHAGGGGGSHESGGDQSPGSLNVRNQDRFLPIANVTRIMQSVLPPKAKIGKDTKETMQECTTEFINWVTCEANDKCQRANRKTINGDDLLLAMTALGFEQYIAPLRVYLKRYRDQSDNKGSGKGWESSAMNDAQPSQVSQDTLFSQLLPQQGSSSQDTLFSQLPSQQGSSSQDPDGNSQASHMMVQRPGKELYKDTTHYYDPTL